jgi:hypothetical protein
MNANSSSRFTLLKAIFYLTGRGNPAAVRVRDNQTQSISNTQPNCDTQTLPAARPQRRESAAGPTGGRGKASPRDRGGDDRR